jgi:uncharacterized protein (DUF2147 family)
MRRFAVHPIIPLSIGYTMLHRQREIMRKAIFLGALTVMTTASALAADPSGDWRVADGVAHIRVAECNGNMWGAVIWEKEPGGLDEHNPDASKRSRPTLGIPILINMKKKAGVDQWEGEVYNANDGKTYSSSIKPVGSDKLEIRGCVLGFLCGGETWTRIAGPIPPTIAGNVAKPTRTTVAPKTTGATEPSAKGQKPAAAAAPDPVGDICLIPDIARFAH